MKELKLEGPDCGRGRNDCMSNIAEIKKNSIDLRIVDPKLNPEKNDYKRVFNWKDAERYDGAADLENKQLIIINSEKYSEIDFDFLKHLPQQKELQLNLSFLKHYHLEETELVIIFMK